MGNAEVACCKCENGKDEVVFDKLQFPTSDEDFPEPEISPHVGQFGGLGIAADDESYSAGLMDLQPPENSPENSDQMQRTSQQQQEREPRLSQEQRFSQQQRISQQPRTSQNWRASQNGKVLTLRVDDPNSFINGIYVQIGVHEHRPKLKQVEGDAVIYFSHLSRWNISPTDTTEGWCFQGPVTDDDVQPPEGEWIGPSLERPPTVSLINAVEQSRLSAVNPALARLMSTLNHDMDDLNELQADHRAREEQEALKVGPDGYVNIRDSTYERAGLTGWRGVRAAMGAIFLG